MNASPTVAASSSTRLRASCGTEGRLPTIEAAPDDRHPILRIAFTDAGQAALLCSLCRGVDQLERARGRA